MAINIARRKFTAAVAGAAFAWPIAARAQQAAMPVIGFMDARSRESDQSGLAAFHQGLGETGYVEGRNVAVEYRWAEGQYDRAPALAADLVARQVAVIVAISLPLARAAKVATTTIPIVFVLGDDPVRFGLVSSMNRPGANITGISFLSPAIEAKRVELLHQLVPQANAIAALVNPKFPSAEVRTEAVRSAANTLGLQLTVYNASSEGEIETAFADIAVRRIGGLLVTTDPFFTGQRDRLVGLAARQALPTAFISREFAIAGGLMSYGSDIADAFRQAAVYVGRVLKGEKPSDLPVLQPTKFELVVNLKTAKALGLTVPQTLLVAANEVIE